MNKILALITIFFIGCGSINIKNKEEDKIKLKTTIQNNLNLTNLKHLDSLYEEKTLDNGTKIGLVHIYSEYPDYKWVKDPIEGVACVDDVARAGILYFNYYKKFKTKESLKKVKDLAQFTLYLQAKNGYFNNFMYPDGSINTTYKTSVAEANWWTWRAIWFLSEIYQDIKPIDKNLAKRVKVSLDRSINTIKTDINLKGKININNGIETAGWLPNDGSNQSAVLLLGLTNYYNITGDEKIKQMIKRIGEGLIVMQVKDKNSEVYGAFLSWKNIWHGYGNGQAYALLKGGKAICDRDMVLAGFKEVDNFHKYLIDSGFINWFSLEKSDNKYKFIEKNKFSQIAYEIRPLIYANLEAYEISRDPKYIDQAIEISKWLFGKNAANINMYDTKTGRTFDGIDGENKYNKNSGAESTIEGLLSILAIEKNKDAKKKLTDYLNKIK